MVRSATPLVMFCAAAAAGAGCSSVPPPDMAGVAGQAHVLANTDITEASGLAASGRGARLVWLHNDSGGQPRLFAASDTGADLGTVTIDGVMNVDWEDLDAYTDGGQPMLLIADVGDNNAVRPVVQLHRLVEPMPPGAGMTASAGVDTLTVTYDDGPRDCEAVAVDTAERAVYLLTKRDEPPRLYRVALDGVADIRTAEFLGTVETIPPPTEADLADDPEFGINRDQPTAMSFTDDGLTAIVVTYKDAYRYTRAPGQAWIDAFAATPATIDIPQMAQTEAGSVTGDGRTLFVASEQLPAPLVRVPLP